jgi:Flp pilus assembly protein TadD
VDEAVEEFRTATSLDPHNAGYQAAYGVALSRQPGRVREAAAAYETALRLKPSDPAAFAGFSYETEVEESMQQAVKLLETRVKQHPGSADAHLRLGLAHAYAGDRDGARREIQRSIELQPANGPAHLALARLSYLSGDWAAADGELKAAEAAGANLSRGFVEAVRRKLGWTN